MTDNPRTIQWIESVLGEVSQLGEAQGIGLMQACGARCAANTELLKGAKAVSDSCSGADKFDELFDRFKTQYYNSPRLSKEGNTITLVFEQCTCPMVEEGVTNPCLCYCTTGYSKKIFETLYGRPVTVRLVHSILRGDTHCKQEIVVSCFPGDVLP